MRREPDLLTVLAEKPVVGIIRGCPVEYITAVGAAAADAGFGAIEVTVDSPHPTEAIAALAEALPSIVVGAGTVRTLEEVQAVAAAGARFIVSPVTIVPVIEAASALGIPSIPGASTPTEIWTALEAGAAAVKVFPARELGGPAYLAAIKGPLGNPPLVPTGGVDATDARAYLDSGALAVGVGGSVFTRAALAAGDARAVASLASDVMQSVT